MNNYNGNLSWIADYNFERKSKYDYSRKTLTRYVNVPCAFDIETTNTYVDGMKFAFMYAWTWGIMDGDYIFYGRTWDEFIDLCNQLSVYLQLNEENRIICYVHNLGFEFQFMRKYFNWISVFATDERKPLKALCAQGIEFRDSYILSGYSLSKLAENLVNHKIRKLEGDLDYKLLRHAETPLTQDELNYMNNDVEILLDYVDEQIEQYGDITKIPLTNTGRVRDYVRNNCLHYNNNHNKESAKTGKIARYRALMKELSLDLKSYLMLKRAFAGGYVHASLQYSGKLLENVHSVDYISAYSYVMLSEKYPMSAPMEINMPTREKLASLEINGMGYMADIAINGLSTKGTFESYLSESKCRNIVNGEINNGRVYAADYLETSIVNVDMDIMAQCYDIIDWTPIAAYGYYMQYLPKQIIMSILKLYGDKTELKNVSGKEVEYLLSKGMLNSVYGMSVTDIIRDVIDYENDDWHVQGKKALPVEELEGMIQKHNKSWRRFLYYPWGVYVTAYNRRNLWDGILEMGPDYVYSDTDSIKYLYHDKHEDYIKKYNKECKRKLKAMCDFRRIPLSLTEPKNIKGEKKPIGIFEYEGKYDYFKTLGAKRYMYARDGKPQITVAGLSKQNGVRYMMKKCGGDLKKVFAMFDDQLTIPANETGKSTHTYIDHEMQADVVDYLGGNLHITSKSAVHLEDCEFSLSISKQYAAFLRMFVSGYRETRAFI